MEPASIRYKNPGAMWGSKLAMKWGASPKAVVLNDGKGQGNNIAVFPTFVLGICAQMDLWMSSKNYANKTLAAALTIWSGGNSVESYIKFVCDRVPGMTRATVMDATFWHGGMAIPFLKAQAWHEAGKPYPAGEVDWMAARDRVLSGDNSIPEAKEGDTIHMGSTGPGVAVLQKLLNCAPTGIYTDESELEFALKLFQIRNGLAPDGICGPLSWATLKKGTGV